MSIRSRTAVAIAATAALTAASLASAPAASADPLNCRSWPWPPNSASQTHGTIAYGYHKQVTLYTGRLNGRQVGWAGLRAGYMKTDLVWMDVSSTGGAGWIQCGPFPASNTSESKAHYTDPDNPNLVFRACARERGGEPRCTRWW